MAGIVDNPKVTLNILGASDPVSNDAQKILFVGPQTAAATAVSGVLQEDVQTADIDTLFGLTSLLAQGLRSFKNINNVNQVDVIPLDDAVGALAAGIFTLGSGPNTTTAGTVTFNIGSRIDRSYPVPYAIGDSITEIGDALDVLILADTDSPFTSNNVAGAITITAENDGTEGNKIGLEVTDLPTGITCATTAMTGGATNPTLTGIFDVAEGIRYQSVVFPTSWGLTELKTFINARWNVDNNVLDGIAFLGDTQTYATLVSTYAAENTQNLTIIGNETVADTNYKGSALFELDYVIASQVAAIRSLRLTEDVSIASFTVAGTNGARDSFGGDAIRSLPYFNTPFANLPAIDAGKGFTETEVSGLATAGVSTIANNRARNTVTAGVFVTTYKTDSAGNADSSFKYTNFVDTASGIREYFFNNLKSRFAQSRLTEGEVQPRRNMANAQTISGYCVKLYTDLSGEDYVLTQAGEDARTFFKDNLSVILDLANRKATVTMKTPMVTQLGNIVGSVQVAFSTN